MVIFRFTVFSLIFAVIALLAPTQLSAVDNEPDRNELEAFDFANGLFSRGMYDMAVKEYKKFIDSYPGSSQRPLADYRIGESYFLDKKYQDALSWLKKFKQKYPSGELALKASLKESQVYFIAGEYDRAKEILQRLVARKDLPEISAAATYYTAEVFLKQGDPVSAEKTLTTLIKDFPHNEYVIFAYMDLGGMYSDTGDLVKSAETYMKAAAVDPGGKVADKARLEAANAYYLAKDVSKAQGIYREIVDAAKDGDLFNAASAGLVSSLYDGDEFQQVIEVSPKILPRVNDKKAASRILYLLGSSFLREDRFSEASKIYDEAIKLYPDTEFGIRSRLNKCWALFKEERPEEALENVDMYIAGDGDDMDEALYLKAEILAQTGRTNDAIDVYNELGNKFKNSQYYPDAVYETALLYDLSGRRTEAVREYLKFADNYPDDTRSPGVLLKAGEIFLGLDDYEASEKNYKLFLAKYPDDPLEENVLFQLGDLYIETKNFDKLIETYEIFLEKFPASKAADSVIYWTGRAYLEKKDWLKAAEYFLRFRSDPKNEFYGMSIEAAAYVLFNGGKKPESADLYFELMKNEPNFVLSDSVYYWTGEYCFHTGKYERSLFAWDLLKQKYPNLTVRVSSLYMEAESLRMLGNTSKAVELFDEVIKKETESPYLERSYLGLGRCYMTQNDPEKALALFEEALRNQDDHMTSAHARFEAGNARSALKDYEEAAKAYMMVAILYEDPELCSKALYRAGEAFAKSGMEPESREMFEELIKRYPENELAAAAKKQLEKVTVEKY